METRIQEVRSTKNKHIKIGVIPGHFATNHSHVNYYIDITAIKSRIKTARAAAEELAIRYSSTHIETIICLEGTEVLGAFLARALSENGINNGSDICVVTPELNVNNQMIFRDNTQQLVWGKQVLLLIASVSTGKTISRSIDCLQYYNGHLNGVAAIFSAVDKAYDMEIHSLFTPEDIPTYETYQTSECPMCKNGVKVDALINCYGYSKL